jgi:peptidoglycan glycosyltransferase
MGISTLNQPYYYYGLPLVLGGGEVNLLEMASAYGVFATEGYKAVPSFILRIEDSEKNIIESSKNEAKKIFKSDPCRIINEVLSDNEARYPMFKKDSNLYFENYPVAAKTGTTQDYKDAWAIGYTPSAVVGVWVGNNNSVSMQPLPSITLSGPIFHQIMEKALDLYPAPLFQNPDDYTERTEEIKNRIDEEAQHSILYYINKDDPLGPPPENPLDDLQYERWETGVQKWLE